MPYGEPMSGAREHANCRQLPTPTGPYHVLELAVERLHVRVDELEGPELVLAVGAHAEKAARVRVTGPYVRPWPPTRRVRCRRHGRTSWLSMPTMKNSDA